MKIKSEEDIEKIRLNKLLASRSKFSRREADRIIEEGRVKVNKKTIKNPAEKFEDWVLITVDDKYIKQKDNQFTAIVYNKAKGELVTKKDPQGRKTIYHVLPTRLRHFIPVGRLDYSSEGVLLLTDSSEVANKLMNSNLERVYNLKLDGPITKAMENAMNEGMFLKNATLGAYKKTKIISMDFSPFIDYKISKNGQKFSKIKVTINEGKNRELRRFFGHFDRNILDLKRVSYGFINLNALPTRKHRYLTKDEYKELHKFLKDNNDNTKVQE